MTTQEFERIYKFVKRRYGIDLSRKKEIVEGRLENYVRFHGYDSYTAYMDAVGNDITGKLEKELVDMLTTNHTFFMREWEHFEYLKTVVLPELKKKEAKSHDLRIWCGAASTGEEPYTLAMLLSDFFGFEHENWDTTILATDISTDALEKAQRGVYQPEQIEVLPDTWRRRYTRHTIDSPDFMIADEIKKQVLFRKLNLMNPLPFKKPLHLVFLRNVMIYFDQQTKNDLLKRIYDVLQPGGYLIIGKTETVDRDVVPFEMVQPSIFRKREK